jgi:hypothetical protein
MPRRMLGAVQPSNRGALTLIINAVGPLDEISTVVGIIYDGSPPPLGFAIDMPADWSVEVLCPSRWSRARPLRR